MVPFPQSLCHRCRHLRLVPGGRGGGFLMCQAEEARARGLKYPPQPVGRCGWFSAPDRPPGSAPPG